MIDTKKFQEDWKSYLKEIGITYIEDNAKFKEIYNPTNTIICSRCSKTKTGKDKATPKEFYVSPMNLRFYNAMEQNSLYYAILSDKYGIHFCDERLDYYDVHPSQLSKEQKIELGKIIEKKCRERNIENIIFQNESPLMSRPYFEMMMNTNLKIYYVSTVKVFKN